MTSPIMSQSLFTYRRLCVVAGVVYFVWWVVVRYLLPEAFNPLGSRLGVCASFFLVLIASSKWEWARRHIASLYAFCATILTLHYYYLYSFNAADPNWLGGAYITVIAVGVTVEAPWALLVYSGAVLGGASYVATRDASVVSLPGTVTILFLINVVGYLRKRADREHLLREKAEAAKIAADTVNRARMLFLANVNHELRTPLAGILGFADLLSRAKLSHDEQLFVERIGANARTLLATVEQILALTSSEATPWKVNQEKVDLPQLVNRVADVARQKCGARGTMTVNVLFDGPAPEVTSDSGLIGYVLGNLLDNAVKFTEAGVIRVTVRQVAGMVPPAAEILVADPGVGIKREQWERVFDPFVQVQSGYDRELGGSGVGLTVARRLARMLGGDVVIQESEVGKGTTVRFFFPCEMVRGSEGTEPGAGS